MSPTHHVLHVDCHKCAATFLVVKATKAWQRQEQPNKLHKQKHQQSSHDATGNCGVLTSFPTCFELGMVCKLFDQSWPSWCRV